MKTENAPYVRKYDLPVKWLSRSTKRSGWNLNSRVELMEAMETGFYESSFSYGTY